MAMIAYHLLDSCGLILYHVLETCRIRHLCT